MLPNCVRGRVQLRMMPRAEHQVYLDPGVCKAVDQIEHYPADTAWPGTEPDDQQSR